MARIYTRKYLVATGTGAKRALICKIVVTSGTQRKFKRSVNTQTETVMLTFKLNSLQNEMPHFSEATFFFNFSASLAIKNYLGCDGFMHMSNELRTVVPNANVF